MSTLSFVILGSIVFSIVVVIAALMHIQKKYFESYKRSTCDELEKKWFSYESEQLKNVNGDMNNLIAVQDGIVLEREAFNKYFYNVKHARNEEELDASINKLLDEYGEILKTEPNKKSTKHIKISAAVLALPALFIHK